MKKPIPKRPPFWFILSETDQEFVHLEGDKRVYENRIVWISSGPFKSEKEANTIKRKYHSKASQVVELPGEP